MPVQQEPRPSLVGFTNKDNIGKAAKIVLLNADPRSADHDVATPLLELTNELEHTVTLDAHSGDADDIGAFAATEIDFLNVLVDQSYVMRWGRECGQQGQSADREVRPLAKERQAGLKSPKGNFESPD